MPIDDCWVTLSRLRLEAFGDQNACPQWLIMDSLEVEVDLVEGL